MKKPETEVATFATYSNYHVPTRDIVEYARRYMGIELLPQQIAIIDALAAGKKVWFGRRAGYATASRVLQTYAKETAGWIKHFDKVHFTAVTARDRKFVYCPVGNIVSWSEGDYDHKYCEYCKKFFDEVVK